MTSAAIPPVAVLAVSAVLFALGLLCLVIHRFAVRLLLGVELILNAAVLNLVFFGARAGDPGGAVFAVAVTACAAAEAAVGLALFLALFSVKEGSDMSTADTLSR